MADSGSEARGDHDNNKGNGLLLYCHHYSYYSQKVIMALHEKKVPFKSQEIQILKGEQYEPWFLRINPKGEVPVLQDGVRVIPGSSRIIDYLEDNFSNGNKPRLVPKDQAAVRQKVDQFRTMLDQLPAYAITQGALLHPDLCGKRRFPFNLPTPVLIKRMEVNSPESLSELAVRMPEFSEALLQKAKQQSQRLTVVQEKEQYLQVLSQVEEVLTQVETELASHVPEHKEWWLCGEPFTTADISLCVLLERLRNLGLSERMWGGSQRPHLARYFSRLHIRDSYQKTMAVPLAVSSALCAWFPNHSCPVVLAAGAAALIIALFAGVALARRK